MLAALLPSEPTWPRRTISNILKNVDSVKIFIIVV